MNSIICCISDCHLGYRHRLKKERLRDYENAFEEAIKKAMEFKPWLIVFGGDIFHHVRPDPRSMHLLVRTLIRISNSTKIILCIGNHEIEGHLKTAYTPLFSDLHENIHVLTTENPHIILEINNKKVGIHGFQYIRNKELAEETLKRISAEISENDIKGDINILCIHQALEHYLDPFEISLKTLREISNKYDLILLGHVHRHQRISEISDLIPAYYIGSTERISFNESENKNGFLIFRNFDFKNPEFIEVSSASMKRIKADIGKKTPEEINMYLEKLIEENLSVKCLQISLEVEIEGGYFDIRREWQEQYPGFTILDVNITPRIKEEMIKIEKMQIDEGVIDEYFEKKGMRDREELKDLCIRLYKKYGG